MFRILPIMVYLMIVVSMITALTGRKRGKSAARTQQPAPNRIPAKHWEGTDEGHDHIKSTALPNHRKLEQLETLKGAGLLTQEEYDQKRKEILREK